MNRKKVAIIGSNGRLGRSLQEVCREDHDLIGLSRYDLDLAWSDGKIREALDSLVVGADVALLSAGNTNVDLCEAQPDEAEQLNVTSVRSIANWCAEQGVRFINFSSDYVFDGEKDTPYTEDDPVEPLSIYGQSKVDGEDATLEASDRNLVVRLTWLYGPGKPLATPDWAVDLAVKQDHLNVVSDRIGSPSYTGDMADALLPLLFDDSASGILHLCNSGSCTWQEWAQFCVDCAIECGVEVKTREVGPLTMNDLFGDRATRPRYTVLSTEKYEAMTGRTLPDWREPLRQYVRDHVAPRFLRI
ncbi:MAG: dTDP-4-dehydrorhamnose reductase [Verrucomicrobiae bacterium]|nr:dTDP-4-dehydrorhamnose reductase [Verrucomicrobiae bacterium]